MVNIDEKSFPCVHCTKYLILRIHFKMHIGTIHITINLPVTSVLEKIHVVYNNSLYLIIQHLIHISQYNCLGYYQSLFWNKSYNNFFCGNYFFRNQLCYVVTQTRNLFLVRGCTLMTSSRG